MIHVYALSTTYVNVDALTNETNNTTLYKHRIKTPGSYWKCMVEFRSFALRSNVKAFNLIPDIDKAKMR